MAEWKETWNGLWVLISEAEAKLEAERKRRDTFLEMLKVEIKNKTLRKRIEAELENQGGK
jgi:hypothetical protein